MTLPAISPTDAKLPAVRTGLIRPRHSQVTLNRLAMMCFGSTPTASRRERFDVAESCLSSLTDVEEIRPKMTAAALLLPLAEGWPKLRECPNANRLRLSERSPRNVR